MLPYVDSHAHLSMLASRGIDAQARLQALFAEGFGAVLDIGTRCDDLPERKAEFAHFPRVRFSAGIWPSAEALADPPAFMERLEKSLETITVDCAADRKVAAIGECGFDRHWNTDSALFPGEAELFDAQAEMALRLGLPLIVHSREAAAETASAIARHRGLAGVIHCFSYGLEEARRFLDLGFHISFSGTITYKNAENQREAARFVPADRLLLETDSPYLAPVPFRGKAAEPGMVEYIYAALAAIRGIGTAGLAESAAGNASRLFGLPEAAIRT
ncbi:MAG: hypothetical protein A2Z99_04995 [Treponema sp. GWB1_62_6]|nr:MAG: hypothetical protein A2001_08300 [Treponema sp. GWC1_61_84]OHE70939.1 MAG: hypothetical protein A2413_13495 [Treponema sp. RIFOXYC1_FULL_61_9]OHE72565.1 MAG: hypothetical protein A2Z99_04995 [Treponema sp. GWB1_62_6]HCM27343.1 TatD family deoxyribonuclease [Treponema sp.]